MSATYVVQTNIIGLLDRKETEFIIPSSDLYMKQLQLWALFWSHNDQMWLVMEQQQNRWGASRHTGSLCDTEQGIKLVRSIGGTTINLLKESECENALCTYLPPHKAMGKTRPHGGSSAWEQVLILLKCRCKTNIMGDSTWWNTCTSLKVLWRLNCGAMHKALGLFGLQFVTRLTRYFQTVICWAIYKAGWTLKKIINLILFLNHLCLHLLVINFDWEPDKLPHNWFQKKWASRRGI